MIFRRRVKEVERTVCLLRLANIPYLYPAIEWRIAIEYLSGLFVVMTVKATFNGEGAPQWIFKQSKSCVSFFIVLDTEKLSNTGR
jgi:Na+-translocating ferredoxin:NAD+ oxidoreductase RnfD subunit